MLSISVLKQTSPKSSSGSDTLHGKCRDSSTTEGTETTPHGVEAEAYLNTRGCSPFSSVPKLLNISNTKKNNRGRRAREAYLSQRCPGEQTAHVVQQSPLGGLDLFSTLEH